MAKKRSKFAEAISAILDASGMTRKEWARALNISESAISQWLNDLSVPKPELLNRFLDLAGRIETATSAVNQFKTTTARLPTQQVTQRLKVERVRLERRRFSCLGDYMLEPSLDEWMSRYERATTEERRALLDSAPAADRFVAADRFEAAAPQELPADLAHPLLARLRHSASLEDAWQHRMAAISWARSSKPQSHGR